MSVNGIMPILSVATCFMYEFISLRLCFQHCLMFFLHTRLITLDCLHNLLFCVFVRIFPPIVLFLYLFLLLNSVCLFFHLLSDTSFVI